MDEAAETGPTKMDGGKTREMELFLSRLPISRNYQDVVFTEWEIGELSFRGWRANGAECNCLQDAEKMTWLHVFCFSHRASIHVHVSPGSKQDSM